MEYSLAVTVLSFFQVTSRAPLQEKLLHFWILELLTGLLQYRIAKYYYININNSYVTQEIAKYIYGGIEGATLDRSSGIWTVPCDREVDVAIIIE